MPDYLSEAQELFAYSQSLRRDFHRHPELGFQEVRTAGVVSRELSALGLEVSTGMAETGVVALLDSERPGPTVMLRFDMDALPITEATGAEYASLTPGLMHACGHDGHMAVGLTVARLLFKHRQELHGRVKMVFQPAEEALGGAERMVAAGVLALPSPERVLGLHLWNEKPLGWLGLSAGPVMASGDIFTARISGRGGHGAIPDTAVDPLLAGAQVVTALQSIVSRNISPLQAAVVSVTAFRSGEAYNVIPPFADLQGTLRSYLPDTRERVRRRLSEIITGVSTALGCSVEINLQTLAPAVVNDPLLTSRVLAAAQRLQPEWSIDQTYRTMGSEDFSFFIQDRPGCYFFVGSANPEKGLDAGHHHPRFDFDEAVLPRAAGLMAAAAADLLEL